MTESDRGLDYTMVLGNDLSEGIRKIQGTEIPYVVFDHDAFLFQSHLFASGEDVAWDIFNETFDDVDAVYILLTGNIYEYSRKEQKAMNFLRKLYDVSMKHEKLYFITMQMDERQTCLDIPKDIPLRKSGYLCKTEGENSIFNVVVFENRQAYLITIVMKGFVSKHISQPIIDAFHKLMHRFIQEFTSSAPNFNFTSDVKFRWPWQPKPKYDTLNMILSNKMIVEKLMEDPEANETFKNLDYQNIIVNFRVLNKDFL